MDCQNKKISSIDMQTSRRITSLRFLLAVLVVFIHNNFTAENLAETLEKSGVQIVFNQSEVGKWIQLFVSEGIARCAVPLFFLFAAYLQFKKNEPFGILIKKKLRTLVLPFFLWTALNIALYVSMKFAASRLVPRLLFRPDVIPQFEWTAMDWLHVFFGYGDMTSGRTFGGYLGQMWFVRDLFLLILVSLLIRHCVRTFPVCMLLFVSFFYVCDVRPLFVAEQALFYYTLGCFWAEYDIPLFKIADRIQWRILIPLCLAIWLVTELHFGKYSSAYWLMVFASCIVMLKFSARIEGCGRAFSVAEYLSPVSFWLFAIHEPLLLGAVQSLWLKLLPMTIGARCLAEYFGVTAIVVALGTGSGFLFRKFCPPLFSVLNGGRK